MRPILPEICCKEVEEWEIQWEEIKAKLNSSTAHTTSLEIQENKEELNFRSQLQPLQQQEGDQTHIQSNQIQKQQTSDISRIINQESRIVDHEFQILNTTTGMQGIQEVEVEYKIEKFIPNAESDDEKLVELNTGDGDVTADFEDWRTSEGSELKVVVVQRPPPEPPNPNSHMVVEAECEPSALELEMLEQRRHHHPMAAAGSTEKGRHAVLGSTDFGGGELAATPGSRPKALTLRRIFLLNPPPLIAAVFPWNRDKGSAAAAGNGAEDDAFAKGKVEDVADVGNRTGLSEMHYRERDDFKSGSGGGAWNHDTAIHRCSRWLSFHGSGVSMAEALTIGGTTIEGGDMSATSIETVGEVSHVLQVVKGGENLMLESRVSILKRGPNETVQWRPFFSFLGQGQAQVSKTVF